jgi:hypothetical protein
MAYEFAWAWFSGSFGSMAIPPVQIRFHLVTSVCQKDTNLRDSLPVLTLMRVFPVAQTVSINRAGNRSGFLSMRMGSEHGAITTKELEAMSVRTQIRCGLLAAGCLALTSTAGAQVVSQQNPGPTYSVYPMGGDNIPSVFTPGFDRKVERPNHPPIDEIPPMPMPEPGPVVFDDNAPWNLTFHDIETGETIELPNRVDLSGLNSGQSPEGDYIGANNTVEGEPYGGRGFNDMFITGGLTTWPRSGNVKLIMRFVDTAGSNRWFVCSGSMGDAGVVVTAGHCVYARTATGPDIFDWAEEVYIYPAWDGNSNNGQFSNPDGDEVIQNFGWARGDAFVAGSDWVNNGNWDRDNGLVRINRGSSRNIGMLTGWFGWAWGGGCDTSRGYNNFSYPAENCPNAGLHNGRDMYYWNGTIDSCPGNQLQLNTGGGGCFNTVWGGMSGSGMYYISGDSRFTHAVASTSNRTTIGRYCKLWEQFVLDMQAFETTTRGASLDLELLRCRALGSTIVQAGTSMNDQMQVYVANATNNNPASNTYTLRVYLSTNNNISSGDTLLATWNYNYNFGSMSGVNFNIPAPNIPITTPAGTYWIGAILDSGTDGVSSNNDTDTWDAQQVTVTLGVPATPTYLSPANGATNVNINDNLDWSAAARASSYDVYFGTDSTPDAGEFQGSTASSFWFLPALNNNTTYYWQIVARNSAGTTAGAVWSFRTEVAPFVDLSARQVFADRGTYFRGQNVLVDHMVTNVGNLASSGYNLDVRASTNQIISTGDVLMSNANYGALNPGASRTITNQANQLPPTMNPGTYYIGIIVNSTEDTNGSNNWISDNATITVLACDADLAAPWGVLDFFDIQNFLNAFSANAPSADMNNDGLWDFFDVQLYLQAFSAGC